MKNNREFDDFIKGKMQGLEPSFVPESWDFLEQKMNASEAVEGNAVPENDMIDKISYEKLHNYEKPFNKSHWELMAGKLEREFYFIQELFRMKTMEAGLMLLLLLTIGRFIPTETRPDPVNADKNLIVHNSDALHQEEINAGDLPVEKLHSANAEAQFADNFMENVAESNGFEKAGSDETGSLANLNDRTQTPFIQTRAMALLENNAPVSLGLSPLGTHSEMRIYLPVHELTSGEIALLEPSKRLLGRDRLKFPQENIIVRIGMYGSPNLDNIINQPLVIGGEEIPSLNRYALGYSGGISVGFGVKRFEVETGLIYTSKRYEPIEVQFVAGNVEKGFKNESFKFFEFNTVSVPLNLKYDFISKGKWRVYALTGGAIHFTAQAFYHVGTPELSDDSRDEPSTYGGRNSVIEQLERGLSEGLFQGGELRENTYLSVNGSLGFERYISDRWSFFSQANYQHTLYYYGGGLGPFKDVLHTFSVSTGLKVRVLGN